MVVVRDLLEFGKIRIETALRAFAQQQPEQPQVQLPLDRGQLQQLREHAEQPPGDVPRSVERDPDGGGGHLRLPDEHLR